MRRLNAYLSCKLKYQADQQKHNVRQKMDHPIIGIPKIRLGFLAGCKPFRLQKSSEYESLQKH